jgi:hypothetical protein
MAAVIPLLHVTGVSAGCPLSSELGDVPYSRTSSSAEQYLSFEDVFIEKFVQGSQTEESLPSKNLPFLKTNSLPTAGRGIGAAMLSSKVEVRKHKGAGLAKSTQVNNAMLVIYVARQTFSATGYSIRRIMSALVELYCATSVLQAYM